MRKLVAVHVRVGFHVAYTRKAKRENDLYDIWDEEEDLQFDFHIENFFLLGSPVALFKSLMGNEFYIRD